jgi:hypothetical protein
MNHSIASGVKKTWPPSAEQTRYANQFDHALAIARVAVDFGGALDRRGASQE